MADPVVGGVTVEVRGNDAHLEATLARDKRSVDTFDKSAAASMKRVENASRDMGKAVAAAADEAAAAAKKEAKELGDLAQRADRLRASIDPVAAAQQRLSAAAKEADDLLRRNVITTAEHTAALAHARRGYEQTTVAAKNMAKANGLAAHEVNNLVFQLNDVVVGLASGQKPLTVLLQQGSQVGQIFSGRPGGLGAGLKAIGGLINPVVVGWGALAGAIALAGVAAYKYSEDSNRAELALMGLGRQTGITAAQLLNLGEEAARVGEVSVGAAREAANAYLQSGVRTEGVIRGLIETQREYALVTGQDAKDAVEELARAFGDPARGAEVLDQKLNFLDQTTRAHIQTLIRQNDITGAQRVLLAALEKDLDGAATHVTGLARAWDTLARSASNAFTAMGRSLTGTPASEMLGSRLAGLQRDLVHYERGALAPGEANRGFTPAQRAAQVRAEIAAIKATQKATEDAAKAAADAAARRRAEKDAADNVNSLDPVANQRLDIQARIERVRKDRAAGLITEAAATRALAAANRQLAALDRRDAGPRGRNPGQALEREADSMRAAAAESIKLANAYLESGEAAFKAEVRREALTRAARSGADEETQYRLQLAATIAETAAVGARNVATLEAQTKVQREANNAVLAGAVTTAQAQRNAQLEAELRPLLIAQALAEGEAKESLIKIIERLKKAYADANTEQGRAAVLQATEQQRDQNEMLALQLTLIGKTNRERAIAIAQLQTMQQLRRANVDASSPEGKAALDAARRGAELGGDTEAGEYVNRARRGVDDEIAAMNQVRQTYGMSAIEAARFRKEVELLNQAAQAGIELSPAQREEIGRIADAYAEAAEQNRLFQEQIEATREAADFMAESFAEGLEGIIFDSQDAGDALRKLVIEIARAAYQALALGKGPLAGIFGTAGNGTVGGGGGGWLGDLASYAFNLPGRGGRDPNLSNSAGLPGGMMNMIGLFHDGTRDASAPSTMRSVSSQTLLTAPRFHSGLGPNEFAAILERGEGVTSRRDMQRARASRDGSGSSNGDRVMKIDLNLKGANGDSTIRRITGRAVASALRAASAEAPSRQTKYQLLGS